jgi:hypothetical protein
MLTSWHALGAVVEGVAFPQTDLSVSKSVERGFPHDKHNFRSMTTRLLWVTKQISDQVSVRILHKLFTPCLESNWDTNHIWLLKIQAIPETELATQSSSDRFKGPSAIIIKFPYTSCTYCSGYVCKAIGTRTVTSNFLKHKKSLKPLGKWLFSARVKRASLLKEDNDSPSWEHIDSLLW